MENVSEDMNVVASESSRDCLLVLIKYIGSYASCMCLFMSFFGSIDIS